MTGKGNGSKWIIMTGSGTLGPMDLGDVKILLNSGEISPESFIKNTMDTEWAPVREVLSNGRDRSHGEAMGLVPRWGDAIFYTGLGIFFLAIFALFACFFAAVALIALSTIIEFGGIYYSHRKELKAITKNVGNIFALVWACFQILILLGIILMGV